MRKSVRFLPFPGKERIIRSLLGKRLDAVDADISTRSGLTLRAPSLREPIAFHLFCNGTYEPETVTAILAHLPPAGTFVDIGANIGAIALEIAHKRPDARVIAIEASPIVLPYLRHNTDRNRLENIDIVPLAASDRDGEIDFYIPPAAHFGMASTAPQFNVKPTRVPARTLEGILADLKSAAVDVIKIDAEGAELDVLRGATRLLQAASAPAIIFEFVDWAEARLHNVGDAQRELIALGYTLSRIDVPGARTGGPLDGPLKIGGAMLLARKQS